VSWLLGALALAAGVATWGLATGRWELRLDPATAQAKLESIRQQQLQTRLAESIVSQTWADQ